MYEVIVIGGGHAGCEASLACAKKGHTTLLITGNIKNIADMPCNPSIGGSAKGIVVREIDALGGYMGYNADISHLQIKMLNSKKGPGVRSLRCQADKTIYPENMLKELLNTPNLTIKEDLVKELLIENFHEEVAKDIINSNIEPQELLLNVMFKTLYSKKIYEIITNWFQDKLRIIYHADKIHYAPNLESRIDIKNSNKKLFSNPQINEAVKEIGLTSEKIAYPITDKKDLIFPVSVIKTIDEKGIVVPAEFFESFGTLRLLDIFPLMMATMKRGATLLVDELDASLHPMIIMSFIKIFHNDEINKNGAQLIFNTHNPIFLNKNLFRRDEIKFVEKEEKESILYSLSDFGTSGKNGVRNGENYLKNYFINKYGAITDVDFSDIFEEYMNQERK